MLNALVRADVSVLIPFGGGLSFDLAAVLPGGAIVRIQVKSGRIRQGCVVFNSAGTDHGRGHLHYRGRADVIAVHVASTDSVYVISVDECPSYKGYLRVDAPRNNQRRRIRLAEDYEVERWIAAQRSSYEAGSRAA